MCVHFQDQDEPSKYLIRDRDIYFTQQFDEIFKAESRENCCRKVPTGTRTANGSCRRSRTTPLTIAWSSARTTGTTSSPSSSNTITNCGRISRSTTCRSPASHRRRRVIRSARMGSSAGSGSLDGQAFRAAGRLRPTTSRPVRSVPGFRCTPPSVTPPPTLPVRCSHQRPTPASRVCG
jgi:hypothetical protein